MPYQVITPDGTTVCATAQEVRQAVDEHLRDHPDDVDFGRVVIEEIGEGRTGVGLQLTPQEFFGAVEAQTTSAPNASPGREKANLTDRPG